MIPVGRYIYHPYVAIKKFRSDNHIACSLLLFGDQLRPEATLLQCYFQNDVHGCILLKPALKGASSRQLAIVGGIPAHESRNVLPE